MRRSDAAHGVEEARRVKCPRGFPPARALFVTHARAGSDRVLSQTLRYFTAHAFFPRPPELGGHPSTSYIGGFFLISAV
jgi:hypothetical protein